jgi:hypothetical protein
VPNPSPDIDAAHPIQGLRAASAISEMRAERLAAEHYGLEVAAHRLDSECDQNFRLTTPDGRDYVVKIANPAEDRAVTNLQTGALLHLAAADPSLPIRRIGLFIADEVQPGLGRTGEEMWALPATASSPIWSPWACRWETAIRWPGWRRARNFWRSSARGRATSTRLAAIPYRLQRGSGAGGDRVRGLDGERATHWGLSA